MSFFLLDVIVVNMYVMYLGCFEHSLHSLQHAMEYPNDPFAVQNGFMQCPFGRLGDVKLASSRVANYSRPSKHLYSFVLHTNETMCSLLSEKAQFLLLQMRVQMDAPENALL